MPEECIGGTFKDLFLTLLDKKLISMALYRLKGAQGNSNSYVYTNPASSTLISHRDRVFVLGHDISDELLGE